MPSLDRQCKALGDPTRFRICRMLARGELCVCEFAETLGLAQSTVSRHLAILRQAGLVVTRKVGHWRYCRLAGPEADAQTIALIELVGASEPLTEPPTTSPSQGENA